MSGSDVARSETIEVTEELSNSDALLRALGTNAGNHIIDVIGTVADDLGLADTSLCLGDVVSAVVNTLTNSEKLFSTINILAEVNVVALVNITLVHVSTEEALNNVLRSSDAKKVEHSEELVLGHMTISGDVVVLEHGLQVNALGLDCVAVLVEDLLNFSLVLMASEILAAGKKSVVLGDSSNVGGGSLIDASDSEGSVDVCNKCLVSKESLGVRCLVLLGESLELVVGESKVHGGQDGLELGASDSSLSKLIEISEELLDTDALHHNGSLESVLDVAGVA